MRQLFVKSVLVFSLTLVVGGHWGIIQGVAWMKMTWDLSADQNIADAIDQVLKGENPCRVCRAVAAGKEAEQDLPLLKQKLKLDFDWRHAVLVVTSPSLAVLKTCTLGTRSPLGQPPPNPPPRFL